MTLTTSSHSGLGTLRILLTWCGAAVLAVMPGAAQPGTGTIRVSPTGANTGTCGAAATPCQTVQHAVNLASTGNVIRVATGTYTGAAACLSTTAVVCIVNKHLTILGGFPTGNWTTATPAATPTILDGGNTDPVILVQDTTLDAVNSASLTLEGATVRRGFVVGPDATGARGAGINAFNSPLNMTNVTIADNVARGGSTASASAAGFGAGGGVSLSNTSALSVFQDVVFERNRAEGGARSGGGTARGGYGQGGALFVFQSLLEGYDLAFYDNQAVGGDAPAATGSDAGGQEADAQGAGACVQVGSDVTFDGVVATGNLTMGGEARTSSGGVGGGAFGSAFFVEQATMTLRNFRAWANQAVGGDAFTGGLGSGGAVMASASTLVMEAGELLDNLSKGGDGTSIAGSAGGGAVYATGTGSSIDVTNVIMADNAAERGDVGSGGAGGGGAMFLQITTGSVVHATLARNRLSSSMQGQAAVLLGPGSDVDFDFTIFAEHTSVSGNALHVQPGNTATLQRGMWSDNDTNAGGGGTINGLGTMLSTADVAFAAPGSPFFDYHLLGTSPAIDEATGSTTVTDVDGDARTDPDIGADEFGPLFSDGFESGNTSAWSVTVP